MRKILSLLPKEYRRGCLRVAALVPVKAVLDLVGVAALIPIMMLVLDPDKLENSFFASIASVLGFSDYNTLAIVVIVSVVLVLVFKIILSLLIINYQNRYLMSLYRNLSSRLFLSLYSRGLLYIKNHNSARMTFNVIGVCYNFVMGHLGAYLRICGEVVFVAFLFIALLIYSPAATLLALCAFVPGVALYMFAIRKPLRILNKEENEARREQNRLINEAFKGYSEVHVNDAFPLIHDRFSKGLENISEYRIRGGLIQSIPSYLLELSVVIIVAALSLFNLGKGDQTDVMFLGICAVSLLKLLPSVRTIVGSLAAINATEYTREVIADINTPVTYQLLHSQNVAAMRFEKEIRCENVSFAYEGEDKPVLEAVNFSIPKGARFGIKGRTGAGKTTLFNVLLGLYPPTEGNVLIDGVPLNPDNLASWHKLIGYVPQDVFVADSTILENVALGFDPNEIDREKVKTALVQASLEEFVNSLPSGVDTKIGEAGCRISGGQRQRLGIARALYKEATVLFFDEATSSLDSRTEQEVNDAIQSLSEQRSELTIIVISHRDSTLSFCDTVMEL